MREPIDEVTQVPEIGNTIRTKKMQMEGKVEKISTNRAGYEEVYFRIADGRLMKTPLSNVIVIEKLEDEDDEIFEEMVSKYNSGKKKVAKEGSMGGINRSHPAQDVSYEKVLEPNPETEHTKVVGESFEDRLRYFLEK